jgi:hypothetical protein
MNSTHLHDKYENDPLADIPEQECVFCHETNDLFDETTLTNKTCGCKYSFHEACIDQWFGTGKHECIMCHTFMSKTTNNKPIVPKFNQIDHDNNDYPSKNILCDYIYLDAKERQRFAQISHDYLIEQIGFENLPDKTMVWTIKK